MEKSSTLIWTTQILTVAYDGAYPRNVSIRMARISFDALPYKKKLYYSLRLHVVERARVA